MFDKQSLMDMFNEWFQLVKKYLPMAEDTEKFWNDLYEDCAKWAQKYEGVHEADRWLVVQMCYVVMQYFANRLCGTKRKSELELNNVLKRIIKDAEQL